MFTTRFRARRTAGVLLAGLLLGAGPGCSDGGSDGSPNLEGRLGREDLALRIAEWMCDDLASCCSQNGRGPIDRDQCVERHRTAQMKRYSYEEEKYRLVFDEASAAECAALLAGRAPDCSGVLRPLEPSCFDIFDGTVALGDACTRKKDCIGFRDGTIGCIEGVCSERLAPGAVCGECSDPDRRPFPVDCTGTCDICAGASVCRFTSAGDQRCIEVRQVAGRPGDVCTVDPGQLPSATDVLDRVSCDRTDGLFCGFSGVCEEQRPLGGDCRHNGYCVDGARCEADVCVPGSGEGEPCQLRGCAEGLGCQFIDCEDGCAAGVCMRHAQLGEECSAERHLDCAPGLRCSTRRRGETGVCTTPGALRCDAEVALARPASIWKGTVDLRSVGAP